MNILIIGSKGFIGGHALQYFKNKGYRVFGADVVVDYDAENYFLIDATNASFQDIFLTQSFDVCVNCSGASSVPDSFVHPQRDFELNVTNVHKLLEAIRKHQPSCKFINLSSAAVYGNPDQLPVRENRPLQPLSPYGLHKKMAEEILLEFFSRYQIPTLSLRMFSVFGPNLKKQLFWDLYKKMEADSARIQVYGTGRESRDFIYIEDLMCVLELVIQKADFNGTAINVADGIEITIAEAVSTFAQAFHWEGEVVYSQTVREGDPLNWKAEISYLQKIGYQPQFTLRTGLDAYTKWLREKT